MPVRPSPDPDSQLATPARHSPAPNSTFLYSLLDGDPAAPVGQLLRLEQDGTRTVLAGSLPAPGGVAVTADGSVYVTANRLIPAAARSYAST